MKPTDALRAAIADAIRRRSHLFLTYKGLPRLVCPHALGSKVDPKGKARAMLLAYQYAGGSEAGLGRIGSPSNWRLFPLDQVGDKFLPLDCPEWFTEDGYAAGPFPAPKMFHGVEALVDLPG